MNLQRTELKDFLARHFSKIPEKYGVKEIGDLVKVTKDGPWICGGAVRRLIKGEWESKSDYDICVASSTQESSVQSKLVEDGHKVKWSNKNCITLTKEKRTVQIIKTYYKDIDNCLDSFDFTICMFGYDGKDLIYDPLALYDLGRKALVPHKVQFPVSSLRRLLKYHDQGYKICSGGLSNFLEQTRPLNIDALSGYID